MTEENKQTSPAPKAETKNSNKTLYIIIGVVVFILVALCICCVVLWATGAAFTDVSFNIFENAVEEALEEEYGDDFEVNIEEDSVTIGDEDSYYTYGDDATWPSDMPSSVPVFSSGDMTSVSKTDGSEETYWTVTYENITTSGALDSYKDKVEAAGFEVSWSADEYFWAEMGTLSITVYVYEDTETGSLTVAQTK
jgi:hypothetical protein